MAVISVNESTQTNDKKSGNWFSKFFRFFIKSKSNKTIDEIMSILSSLTSRLLTRREFDLILEHLPQDSYETNSNQTIYSLKMNGKPFFIDFCQYNYDIYWHQTNAGNGLYFCDKHRDLMYVLRILFYEQNISEMSRKELEFLLKVLPKSYYEVNANQTIYSFKLNGKPFFIDKSHYIYEEYPTERMSSRFICSKVNEIPEETDISMKSSKILGQKYAEKNRKAFLKLKTRANGFKDKFENSLINGYNNSHDVYNKRQSIPQNKENNWNKTLAKRRVYQKSDLMIQANSSKEAKNILSKCRESLFDWSGRNERRKQLEIKAKLLSVNNCDLLSSRLYAICEAIEPNDVNHNPSH